MNIKKKISSNKNSTFSQKKKKSVHLVVNVIVISISKGYILFFKKSAMLIFSFLFPAGTCKLFLYSFKPIQHDYCKLFANNSHLLS